MADRIRDMKKRILKDHVPEPVDKDLEREVDGIVSAAKRNLSE